MEEALAARRPSEHCFLLVAISKCQDADRAAAFGDSLDLFDAPLLGEVAAGVRQVVGVDAAGKPDVGRDVRALGELCLDLQSHGGVLALEQCPEGVRGGRVVVGQNYVSGQRPAQI